MGLYTKPTYKWGEERNTSRMKLGRPCLSRFPCSCLPSNNEVYKRNCETSVLKMYLQILWCRASLSSSSMDWFKGQFTGKPHDLHGKFYGFRLRISQQNQSIDIQIWNGTSRVLHFCGHQNGPNRRPQRLSGWVPPLGIKPTENYPC